MSARLLFAVASAVVATLALATAETASPEVPLETVEGQEPRTNLGPLAAKNTTYRWMWGDAGKESFGHWVAELNPLRWSLWADAADTRNNMEQYKKRGDKHRPVQMQVGPPPLKTMQFSNIGQAVEYLNNYLAPWKKDPTAEVEPSYDQEVASKKSYPPGVFVELGGKAQTKFEAGTVKMAAHSSGRRIRWGDLAELVSITSVGLVLLGVLVAALRHKRPVSEQVVDEEATSSEVLPWVEQGNLSASESDIEQQFLRMPLRLDQEVE